MCRTIYADILWPDLVGARLLRWEADLVFTVWLSAWVQWHASLLPLLSGSRDADLHAHLLRLDTRAFAFSKPIQVAAEPQGSVGWHVDFLLRDRAKVHSLWPGDVIHLCGSSFNWAHGLPLLEVLMASSAVRLDSVIARARRGTGSVHLIYGSEAQTRAGLAKAEADSSAVGLLACSKKADALLWASLAGLALEADWVPVAEWADSEAGLVRALLVRPRSAGLHSRLFLPSGTPWIPLAGLKGDERALGVDEVVRGLLDVTQPKVTQWSGLVAWMLLPSTYSAVRRRQAGHLSLLQEWWSHTWRVCSHERVSVGTAQSCQLCGDTGYGLGCPECSTHVCLSCHHLAEAGWPGGSGPKRELSRRNASLHDKATVAAKMDEMSPDWVRCTGALCRWRWSPCGYTLTQRRGWRGALSSGQLVVIVCAPRRVPYLQYPLGAPPPHLLVSCAP